MFYSIRSWGMLIWGTGCGCLAVWALWLLLHQNSIGGAVVVGVIGLLWGIVGWGLNDWMFYLEEDLKSQRGRANFLDLTQEVLMTIALVMALFGAGCVYDFYLFPISSHILTFVLGLFALMTSPIVWLGGMRMMRKMLNAVRIKAP